MPLLSSRRGALALILMGSLVASPAARAQDEDAPAVDDLPHITTLGTASESVAPDTADIRIGVFAVKPSAAEAWDAAGKLAQGVIDAAQGAGVQPSDIATTNIGFYEQFDPARQPDGSSKRISSGYRASHDLRIQVRDLSKIGSLTQLLVDKGANQFGGISFRAHETDALRGRLAAEALRQARKAAEALATAGNVKLGRLLKIERPDRGERGGFAPADLHAVGAAPIAPGTTTVSDQVEATFAIE